VPGPHAFFDSEEAESFLNPAFFPPEIDEFLRMERCILDMLSLSVDTLIEVGCHQGLNLDWAINHNKRYIGIDISSKSIDAGRQRLVKYQLSPEMYRFVEGAAEDLEHLLEWKSLQPGRSLIFFPFNSFGLVPDIAPVLTSLVSLHCIGFPFLISSYPTTSYATRCRHKYYEQCGYKQVEMSLNYQGVRFIFEEGLQTIAYHSAYLQKVFDTQNLPVVSIDWSDINEIYLSCPIATT
jgi:hypothetical protein